MFQDIVELASPFAGSVTSVEEEFDISLSPCPHRYRSDQVC